MAGQEEVVQPDNMAEVWQDVAKPGDQPTEGEDCPHLSPKNQSMHGRDQFTSVHKTVTRAHYSTSGTMCSM